MYRLVSLMSQSLCVLCGICVRARAYVIDKIKIKSNIQGAIKNVHLLVNGNVKSEILENPEHR